MLRRGTRVLSDIIAAAPAAATSSHQGEAAGDPRIPSTKAIVIPTSGEDDMANLCVGRVLRCQGPHAPAANGARRLRRREDAWGGTAVPAQQKHAGESVTLLRVRLLWVPERLTGPRSRPYTIRLPIPQDSEIDPVQIRVGGVLHLRLEGKETRMR